MLLRLLHGLLAPTAGTHALVRAARAAARQAMVFQRPVMLRRSALAQRRATRCGWPACRAPSATARARRRSRASASRRSRDRPARVLSGGEQQRLALARAWALRARGAVPRRADRQPRPRRHARGRALIAEHRRRRHDAS
ncbi:MAG: ATP-binding cassette domain-containing protein [Candidatus Moduliflexus flocculans]|nr:ATP-binding cassette domain-containing protein [Candidatus Moduliflexus flocculans]